MAFAVLRTRHQGGVLQQQARQNRRGLPQHEPRVCDRVPLRSADAPQPQRMREARQRELLLHHFVHLSLIPYEDLRQSQGVLAGPCFCCHRCAAVGLPLLPPLLLGLL